MSLEMDDFGSFPDSISFDFQPEDFTFDPIPTPQPAPPSIAASGPTTSGPRAYKSRKYRPCDFCRARKSACKIDVSPPCRLCTTYGRECTFVEQPGKRKRRNTAVSDGHVKSDGGKSGTVMTDGLDRHLSSTSPHSLESPASQTSAEILNHISYYGQEPQAESPSKRRASERIVTDGTSQLATSDRGLRSAGILDLSSEDDQKQWRPPLGIHQSKTSFLVGDTGEADPYLLRRYPYDENDECVLSRITYRRVWNNNHQFLDSGNETSASYFMLPDDGLAEKDEPRHDTAEVEKTRQEVGNMFKGDLGIRMVKLFFRYVYPYFPILSRRRWLSPGNDIREMLDALPLSLLAALYATSLPFLLYDEVLVTSMLHSPPSSSQLWRAAWLGITQEIHSPRLTTIQACLLLLQRPATNRYLMETPFQWSVLAWTCSLAQVMGLHKDSSGWTALPVWERRLRGRLWWAVYTMDKWAYLGAGIPCHIRAEDFDVQPPTLSQVPSGADHSDPLAVESHFYHLVHLTMIVSDIYEAFYTLRATSYTSIDFSLSLDLAKPLRARLKSWKEGFSLSHPEPAPVRIELDGNPSLKLAYIVATMTLFRALLRPLESQDFSSDDMAPLQSGRSAVLTGAKECSKEAIEFVEGLGHGAWDAFWHSWSRANFAMASSFLMRVCVNATSPAEKEELKDLVLRWRRVLRPGSGTAGNGMMSLALLRLEGSLFEGLMDTGVPSN